MSNRVRRVNEVESGMTLVQLKEGNDWSVPVKKAVPEEPLQAWRRASCTRATVDWTASHLRLQDAGRFGGGSPPFADGFNSAEMTDTGGLQGRLMTNKPAAR